MDKMWSSLALYQVVERTTSQIFSGKYHNGRTPHLDVRMGGAPPSYDFTMDQLDRLSKDVTKAVNGHLKTELKPLTGTKPTLAYRDFVLKLWSHMADQLGTPVTAAMTDWVSR